MESATYNFEEDLLNQAKVMEANRLSNKENRVVNLSEIPTWKFLLVYKIMMSEH